MVIKLVQSISIDRESVWYFKKYLQSLSDFNETSCTNGNEIIRGRISNSIIIVYHTGSITYNSDLIKSEVIDHFIANLAFHSKIDSNNVFKLKPKMTNTNCIDITIDNLKTKELISILSNDDVVDIQESDLDYVAKIFICEDVKLTIYNSGKVYVAKKQNNFKIALNSIGITTLNFDKYDIVIGQDEVGTGEMLGPMIVGSVVLTSENIEYLQNKGIVDSKRLTKDQIITNYELILHNSFSLENNKINASRFSELVTEFKTKEGKSTTDLIAWAHSSALGKNL